MKCQSLSFLLAIGLSRLTDALPNPSLTTKNLPRQVNPDSYCASFPCTPPAVPVFNSVFNTCGCKTIPPQCANLTCDALHHQSYNSSTGKCTCEFGTGITPVPTSVPPYLIGKTADLVSKRAPSHCPNIVCGAGNTLDSEACFCTPMWPPDACPSIECIDGYHPVYHGTTGSCGCDVDCPSLSCASSQTPSYNSSSLACTCEDPSSASPLNSTIIQLSPTTSNIIPELPAFTFANLPSLTDVRVGPPITKTFPALQPTTSQTSVSSLALPPFTFTNLPSLTDIRVRPPITKTFPALRPTTFQTSVASLALPPFLQNPPVVATAKPSLETAPVAFPPPTGVGCADLVCIAEMRAQFDSVSGKCECVWIDGLGPSGT
ncbi:hypothetical protein L207DRAFT_626941 [Hyaloscypha variabilis F]|uniref:EGF-like domain-containing protein n=1 Tax=Hyaloscypha variabilis (strain UAMH 11265 / GT02V1 / F) TaxID=1149755 RepID=A0A2J6SBM9_HYAVF|nr:hypothetical protein L207DRAFT_626941 [Hyaloscypha variabilis F]